jgi:hypothetical protein
VLSKIFSQKYFIQLLESSRTKLSIISFKNFLKTKSIKNPYLLFSIWTKENGKNIGKIFGLFFGKTILSKDG